MRLSKIKLAGFKSFVDPTTIPFPTNLVGIVGPNGCGKSNTIDAVRWVMGESSAKNLRGDSMADVIFNGSNSRKPVGQASIELIFDNSDGGLGGEYATYAEISIKRTVTRDGQSSYYLNGTRCRRRDITDIFLGTGLGPRSYAIIEQGTISRIIEARPEELRIFLEEAAGISKYKERRKETEQRMNRTRENLDRLNDLREELDKQLSHLQRQAKTAERYKELKQEERLLKAQLQALRFAALDAEGQQHESHIREYETALEAQLARQRHAEAETERQREEHVEATESFNEVQSRFYGIGADIARLEQSIHHARERFQRQQYDLAQVERSWNEAQEHLDSDRRKIEEIRETLMQLEPEAAQAQEGEQLAAATLAEAEQAMHDWQVRWDEFNRNAAEPSQTAQVERARIQHLEQQITQLQQRLKRIDDEKSALAHGSLEDELALLREQAAESELTRAGLEEQLAAAREQIATQREATTQTSSELDTLRTRLQHQRGRRASLEALQQAALGKRQGAVSEWLKGHGFGEARRLAQGIRVADGWDRAVECVLGDHLEAVCVDGLDPLAGVIDSLQKGSITFFDTSASPSGAAAAADRLLAKVEADWDLGPLLAGVHAVETLNEALALRPRLGVGESVVTRDGLWLGADWLRVSREADEHAGVLHREQELRLLVEEIAQLEEAVAMAQARLEEGRERLHALEAERDAVQSRVNEAARQHGEVQAQVSGRQARLEQIRQRSERLASEADEVTNQLGQAEIDAEAARLRLHTALGAMDELAIQREELTRQRETLRDALEQARQQARNERETAHQVVLRIQTLRTELSSTEQALERMDSQLRQLAERREELLAALAEGDEPIHAMQQELEGFLARRMEVEQQLANARRRVEEVDHALRALDAERISAERQGQEIRSTLERLRMHWQEIHVRRETLQEGVAEAGYEMQAVLADLPEGAEISTWERQVEDVAQRISRLGPINLAAIEEYQQQAERKNYLDAQNKDLTEALETLENAIRKIDRETRTRFRETFDKVNKGLQEKFPRLFGGGHAYLELTGEDLLDTGVAVMARPPGKKNSTIHLLSGGEKALTAVALVFAIFELNPSPFCMLDEVDAPLDEANVGRFCNLVREMSEQVQFIFITHNKATMELATHLAGVTMHEPGVSRMVAVDVEQAMELAAVG
ncbi:MAG: chromosome segregation protein SMC [Gammaproteobacteria bacterium]|nr:chromosome segregation protein SMC [Gammaproteobacteria bacterium]